MAKGSVRKVKSGTNAFISKMKAVEKFKRSLQERRAKPKRKLCSARLLDKVVGGK